jgi:NADH-quinone oxidoreductase subunit A
MNLLVWLYLGGDCAYLHVVIDTVVASLYSSTVIAQPHQCGRSAVPEIAKYTAVAVFLLVAAAVPTGMLLASYALSFLRLRPRPPIEQEGPYKRATYESGAKSVGSASGQFHTRYYFFALIYLLFAVEAVFLCPWAMRLKFLGVPGLIAMFVFLGIQVVGFLYEWKRGGLEWE